LSSTTVIQIMHAVSASGQESVGGTREAIRQVERLAQLAGQLLTSVEVFKLREERQRGNTGAISFTSRPGISRSGLQSDRYVGQGATPSRPNYRLQQSSTYPGITGSLRPGRQNEYPRNGKGDYHG
ncbi:MAG TPA: hypothetical protein VH593_32870, partial [Ktedonobacteraceae bacterium]